MVYSTSITLEPFLLSKSTDYRQQLAIQRAAMKQGLIASRMHPMMPLREEKMLLTLTFMLSVAIGFAILFLGGFHIYLTMTAQTTIEFHGNITQRKRARAVGQKWKNPYSRGSWRSNWEQVYGTQYQWIVFSLLPSRREPEFLPVPVPGHPGRRRSTNPMAAENDGSQGESCQLRKRSNESDILLTTNTSAV